MSESGPTREVESMSYSDELTKAMTWLGEKPDTVFLGQSVAYQGNSLFKTLSGVPMEKRIELPVAEEMQLGMSIGLALTGKTVISIFPRFDFLMCCMNQLVNHLDKGLYKGSGKVIIRVCVGSTKPMHPGVQHCGDYTEGLRAMLKNINIRQLVDKREITAAYTWCYSMQKSSLLIEYGDLYAS